MPGIGRTVLTQTGIPITVQATHDPNFPMIGHTLYWDAVTPLTAPYTDQSGLSLPAGARLLRFGQVMVPITSGPGAGMWGPYDPAATDGRQLDPTPGNVGILNESMVRTYSFGITTNNDTWMTLLTGGTIFIDRTICVQAGSSATPSLANGPSWAKLFAALPTLVPFKL